MRVNATTVAAALSAMCCLSNARAQFTYATNSGSVTITGYNGAGGAVSIPSTIDGLPTTGIGDGAFANPSAVLTSINIPDTVTNIGDYAFENCAGLTSFTLPDSVVSLGDWAMEGCSGVTNLAIGSGLINLGLYAVADCDKLTVISVNPSNAFFSSVQGVLFDKSQTALLRYPGGLPDGYVIPWWVSRIGIGAFAFSTNVTSLTIPDSVTTIDVGAFLASALRSVTMGRMVGAVGSYAFAQCTNLTNIVLGGSVTKVDGYAFYGCLNLSSVTFGGGLASIGDHAFDQCPSLRAIYFLGNPPVLGVDVFSRNAGERVYFVAGAGGWGGSFAGLPATSWQLQLQSSLSGPGIGSNRFNLTFSGPGGFTVMVEACTNLAHPVWLPVATNLLTGAPTPIRFGCRSQPTY